MIFPFQLFKDVILIFVPLSIVSLFSLAASKIFTLPLVFSSFNIKCLGFSLYVLEFMVSYLSLFSENVQPVYSIFVLLC